MELEDNALFNAGTGSVLTTAGTVEMDASIMVMKRGPAGEVRVSAGAAAAVSRVKNPVTLARAIMEKTPHVMLAASGAHRFARRAGIALCRSEELITAGARQRWRARQLQPGDRNSIPAMHGTVGAVAIDSSGNIAAGTSTGGVPGKIPGRIGDSAIIGAGTFVSARGGASATGSGEAIILVALCREAVAALSEQSPSTAARHTIATLLGPHQAEGGIVIVDHKARIGFAHNAAAMQVATFDSTDLRHFWVAPLAGTHS